MERFAYAVIVALVMALGLAGCSSKQKSARNDPFAGKGSPHYNKRGPLPEGGGKYHIGKPYQVAGKWYTPREQPNYDKKGTASWYGEAFHARKTANGEWFDMNDLTAAHPTLPIPSYAKVTNLENGKDVIVRINDRGPFVGTRLIDLSKATSKHLGFKNKGKADVRVQWIAYAPLNDKGYRHLSMMNRNMEEGASIRQLASAAKGEAGADVQVASARPRKAKKVEIDPVQLASYEPPPEAPTPRDGGYVVQVATFSDLENAQAAADAVAAHGPIRLLETNGETGLFYRVQVGPISSKSDATTALYAVRDGGFPEAKLARIVIQQVSSR
jgi:rare lipoprotein A